MVDFSLDAVKYTPPLELAGNQKPRKPDEEQKFSHQIENILVKSQLEPAPIRKVGSEAERKRWKRGKRRLDNSEEIIEKEEEKKNGVKGSIIDFRA